LIFIDTNVVSETLRIRPAEQVLAWLAGHDAELALSSIVIGELAFGISKIHPDQRAQRLATGLDEWRRRFAGRIFAFTEESALIYGQIMGAAARSGRPMSAQDGTIAAIARAHDSPLATRNGTNFALAEIAIINPWGE